MNIDNSIICVSDNEPIPLVIKEEIKAQQIFLGAGPTSSRMLASRLTGLLMDAATGCDRVRDWLGPDPIYDDGLYQINPDCKTDHGERTNFKIKDQPFYLRGRNGKMRGY